MSQTTRLSPRSEQILCSIVKTYIETGEPVASGNISRLRRFKLSSASVRAVMAELAASGYLSQPHTSAGRIPTGKAFQVFVDSLPGKRLLESKVGQIREKLEEAGSMEDRMERASHMLTEMTQGVAITAAIPTLRQTLDQVELILLDERRVLMIVVTRDKLVRDSVVLLDEPITQDQLTSIRNYINTNFSGWIVADIQAELRLRLEQTSAAYDSILRRLSLLYRKGLLEVYFEPEVHLEGASNLVAFELHLTKERLKELFRALEEKKRLVQLLDRFLEQPAGQLGIRIGLEDEHPSMRELALIGIAVQAPGGLSTKMAVLGPLRMDYERAMSAVLHVGRAFGTLPS